MSNPTARLPQAIVETREHGETWRGVVPTRPILRYHGGKWILAPWIISHFPKHRVYVEAFGGGGSVLMRKARSYAEVYNDLDSEIVSLLRVIQRSRRQLARGLARTPFAREEYRLSFERSADPIEQARRTIVRSFMGFGSNSLNREIKSGFRAHSNRSGTTPAHDWQNYPKCLRAMERRLMGVTVENKDAIAVMEQQDTPETLHYLDPPYVHSTRAMDAMHGHHGYAHEMTDADHVRLADAAHARKGMVIVSGYPSELYDRLYVRWHRVERSARGHGACERTEVLWLNAACAEAIRQPSLFSSYAGGASTPTTQSPASSGE